MVRNCEEYGSVAIAKRNGHESRNGFARAM